MPESMIKTEAKNHNTRMIFYLQYNLHIWQFPPLPPQWLHYYQFLCVLLDMVWLNIEFSFQKFLALQVGTDQTYESKIPALSN